jgi:Domain of unknown function (DUF202)
VTAQVSPPGGLQPERTALAWRRTALTVAVGSLVAMRVLSGPLGPAGVALGVAGLLWSLDLARTARLRYAAAAALVTTDPHRVGPLSPVAGPHVIRTWWATLVVAACALVSVLVLALH